MKSSLFVATCVALALSLSGCSGEYMTLGGLLSQKEGQTYKPYSPPPEEASSDVKGRTVPFAVVPRPEKFRVGILLPLSGDQAALGQAMLNAAQQAVFDAAGPNFELRPRDTAAKGGAEEAARAAVAEGAQLIIGPVFASEVPSVRFVARATNIMMMPLSTDTSLAERGVFVMGLAPGPQVERVVSYTADHGGRNFAALIPSTAYGSLVEDVFVKTVEKKGGRVVELQFFDPSSSSDIKTRVDLLAAKKDGIDALFLPEGGPVLKTVVDRLLEAGFSRARTRILGTGLWDVPGLGKQNPLLVGGWYAAPDPVLRRRFMSAYGSLYNETPPRLATLAYDATALAATLAKRGGEYTETNLTNPNGFIGLDGIFRLKLSGHVERAMAVNEVTLGAPRVVSPAPASFVPPKAASEAQQ